MKNFSKIIGILIAAALIAIMIPVSTGALADTWDGTSEAEVYDGGTGTADDPYQIATGAQLNHLAKTVNAGETYAGVYFKMTNDIDLDNKEWTPIGISSKRDTSTEPATREFSGIFDGNGCTIYNMTIHEGSASHDRVGLFGICNMGTIKNLNMVGADVSSVSIPSYVSIICSYLYGENALMSNCTTDSTSKVFLDTSNTDKTSGINSSIGGVTARVMDGATIEYCVNNAEVSAKYNMSLFMGGITAVMGKGATVMNCCVNNGDITGEWLTESIGDCGVGGLVGAFGASADSTDVILKNSYNTGAVKAGPYSGGIIGKAQKTGGQLINCHNLSAEIAGSIGYTGSIVGMNAKIITIEDCHTVNVIKEDEDVTFAGYAGASITIKEECEVGTLDDIKLLTDTIDNAIIAQSDTLVVKSDVTTAAPTTETPTTETPTTETPTTDTPTTDTPTTDTPTTDTPTTDTPNTDTPTTDTPTTAAPGSNNPNTTTKAEETPGGGCGGFAAVSQIIAVICGAGAFIFIKKKS